MSKKLPVMTLGLLLALGSAAPAADTEVARKLLDWREDWPGVHVRVPLSLYKMYLAETLMPGLVAPESPVEPHVSLLALNGAITDGMARLDVTLTVIFFDGAKTRSIPLLPKQIPWDKVTVNGRPGALREADGWLDLDLGPELIAKTPREPGGARRIAVTARTELRGTSTSGGYALKLSVPAFTQGAMLVDSAQPWVVRVNSSPFPFSGDKDGTHGRLPLGGSAAAADLLLTWQAPQPEVSRIGIPMYDSYVVWNLEEGMQEVRARLDVRIVGGDRDNLLLQFPTGADRISVTGPDVREVRSAGASASVALKGRIAGATRLDVQFALPWPAGSGKTALGGFGVSGGRLQGGAAAVTAGTGGVLLEDAVQGVRTLDSWDIPPALLPMISAPVALAYSLTADGWRIGVDRVSLSELPMRETLIDEARYTILIRPDGSMMEKVELRVRNRNRQFLRVRLPKELDRLVLVRVSEKPALVSRSPEGDILIPLDKSIQTVAGAVSFPVEMLLLGRGESLTNRGDFRLLLPNTDLPAARALCTIFLPDSFQTARWTGAFVPAEKLSADIEEMQYGYGHRAPGESISADEASALLAQNRYRAALDAYKRGELNRAGQLAQEIVSAQPGSSWANEAGKLLSNTEMLQGKVTKEGREARAEAAQITRSEQARVEDISFKQQDLLRSGWERAREGKNAEAADAFRVAQSIQTELTQFSNREKGPNQPIERANRWLNQYDAQQKMEAEKAEKQKPEAIVKLQQQFEEVQNRAAGRIVAREADAPNVKASNQIAFQRLSNAPNAAMQRDDNLPVGGSIPQVGSQSEAGQRTRIGQTVTQVEQTAKELAGQRRFEEADRLLSAAEEALKAPAAIGGKEGKDALATIQKLKGANTDYWSKSQVTEFDVRDIAPNQGQGMLLGAFLDNNYNSRGPQWEADTDAYLRTGEKAPAPVEYADGKIMVNDQEVAKRVGDALDNMRKNLGQKVALNSKTLEINGDVAARLGVRWNDMANGRWAVVDEGTINALQAIVQKEARQAQAAPVQQEIVPGTSTWLGNGANFRLDMAKDFSNAIALNGSSVELTHEQVLLVEANGALVALRAGATQSWTEDPNAPRFAEVPMEIVVPAVGRPAHFEKLLVNPEDKLVIECRYHYKEEGR